jgi:hypothetical protein
MQSLAGGLRESNVDFKHDTDGSNGSTAPDGPVCVRLKTTNRREET